MVLLISAVPALGAYAQFISPGKLSAAHSFLEGISNCTSCHELRNPEISNNKCVDCHTPIKTSITEKKGVHGSEDFIGQNCASCHKEHYGLDFDVLRFDSTDFDHAVTGFALEGQHLDIECEDCHAQEEFMTDSVVLAYRKEYGLMGAEGTFLGLDSDCTSCHASDSPHGDQFVDQSCATCHTAENWEEASEFDHNEARFTLTGAHIDVSCESCHGEIRFEGEIITQYVGLDFESCESCHEDIHEDRLDELEGQTLTCESCHTTEDWHAMSASFPEQIFPHEETGYPLLGAHVEQTCESCHAPRDDEWIANQWKPGSESYTYPEPVSETCQSCHTDYHEGVFDESELGNSCESCHTLDAWYPSTFGITEHAKFSQFELIGAHLVTPCFSCHATGESLQDKPQFAFDEISCESCHSEDNPHGDLTGIWKDPPEDTCEGCHSEVAWSEPITFDHTYQTGYALTGAHLDITCASCHFTTPEGSLEAQELIFMALDTECASCHESDSPHQGQFEQSVMGPSCETCHTTESFTLDVFDHSKTSFPLDGAHIGVACADCHKEEMAPDGTVFTRFFPLSSQCSSCHGQ